MASSVTSSVTMRGSLLAAMLAKWQGGKVTSASFHSLPPISASLLSAVPFGTATGRVSHVCGLCNAYAKRNALRRGATQLPEDLRVALWSYRSIDLYNHAAYV